MLLNLTLLFRSPPIRAAYRSIVSIFSQADVEANMSWQTCKITLSNSPNVKSMVVSFEHSRGGEVGVRNLDIKAC